jgi:hypothetical protein
MGVSSSFLSTNEASIRVPFLRRRNVKSRGCTWCILGNPASNGNVSELSKAPASWSIEFGCQVMSTFCCTLFLHWSLGANVYQGVHTQPVDRLILYESLLKIELNQGSTYKVTPVHINSLWPVLPIWEPLRSQNEFVHPLWPLLGIKGIVLSKLSGFLTN